MTVVDTNVPVALVLKTVELSAARSAFIRNREWHAPAIWISEFRNVVATHLRTGRIEPGPGMRGLRRGHRLVSPSRTHQLGDEEVMKMALASGCTAYDCEYAALAHSLGVPLVTWDGALLRSFPDSAVRPEQFVAA